MCDDEKIQQTESKHIDLEKVINTRDLGGLETEDGMRIKQKALIRSGALSDASDSDIEVLTKDYHLATIIDLRTEEERNNQPDPIEHFAHVRYRCIPLLNAETVGITRGGKEELMKQLTALQKDPIGIMENIYPKMMLDRESEKGFKEFFDELVQGAEGAILWHCSVGKDRAGLSTALLLSALGVPKKTIVSDYLATNKYLKSHTQQLLSAMKAFPVPDLLEETVQVLNSADSRFLQAAFDGIDSRYGDLETYLHEVLKVTDEKKRELKKKYLVA